MLDCNGFFFNQTIGLTANVLFSDDFVPLTRACTSKKIAWSKYYQFLLVRRSFKIKR